MGDNVTPLRPVEELDEAAALRAVAEHVLGRLDAHVPEMGAAYQREVPEYAAMDEETFASVLRTSSAFVRNFAVALSEGNLEPLPDRAALIASGRRRQRAGISLDAAMHAFRIASRVGWMMFADASTAVAPALVSTLASRWIEYADRASTAFAEGHTTATGEQLRVLDARRQALVTDLLAAPDEAAARGVAATHGVSLGRRVVAAVVDTDRLDAIEAVVPRSALVGRRSRRSLVLVDDRLDGRTLEGLARLAVVAHGRPARPGPELAAEVSAIEATIDIAGRLGLDGVVGPDDVLLHRVVTEHDALGRHLRRTVLGPLVDADADGTLRQTLRAYLAHGALRSTADALYVHANTVTYRIKRVLELTGLDARVPHDATSLVLALALEELDAEPAAAHDHPRPLTDGDPS